MTFVLLGAIFSPTHLAGQWVKYPTADVPRKTDGSVNMSRPPLDWRMVSRTSPESGRLENHRVPDQHRLTPEQADSTPGAPKCRLR